MENTLKGFAIGISIGAMLGAYFGFQYGVKVRGEKLAKPEFRIVMATVILVIWALAQILSLLFQSAVDSWLNVIMGAVVGFFFGDGLAETFTKKK